MKISRKPRVRRVPAHLKRYKISLWIPKSYIVYGHRGEVM